MLNNHHILYDSSYKLYTNGEVKCQQGKGFKKGEVVTVQVNVS